MSPIAWVGCWPSGTKAAPRQCVLNYRGEVAKRDTRLLTAAFCAGLLEGAMDEEVNIVNAEVLLRERGIELVEESQHRYGHVQFADDSRSQQ